ncbi:MAG: bifunctional [glutamate--ammonia ligase]-adenylyl-L-tyrosine phosphorylase/[glutamate--ammonia-ligase] adenylyltransferase [Deferrisomatales bacterium]
MKEIIGIQGRAASGAMPHRPTWWPGCVSALRRAGLDPEGLDPEARDRLELAVACSPTVARWLAADPSLVAVFGAPDLARELGVADYARRLAGGEGAETSPEAFFRHLRQVRRREMVRIVVREAAGRTPVEETAREVSALAEAAVERALAWAMGRLEERYGALAGEDGRPNRPCVLGMGKLGGGELNLSSDVDVIFLYRTGKGRSEGGGGGRLDARSYFSRLVSAVAEALGKPTEDGVVFRVDLDLRPEGRSGELAQPVDNALLYYQSWGQTWERAVLLKARPVAGDRRLGEEFLREVEPFVYRRSLDYTTVEDIKEMKRRIDHSAARRLGGEDDLKVGRGGIREVEFFVQTLQLVHGGKMRQVRSPNTLKALEQLEEAGVVEPEVAGDLARCYRFLRTVEHGVQALHFRQTHRLPAAAEELEAVALKAGFGGNAPELLAALDDVRSQVHRHYGRLVHGAEREWEEEPESEWARRLLHLAPDAPGTAEALREAGFVDVGRAAEGLRLLREGPPRGHPSPRARQILDRIAPFLLGAVTRCPHPDRGLLHLGEFLAASGARASYLALLEENPPTARLLVSLFGTSEFLSRYLVGHPELLDELVLGSHAVREKSREEMEAELASALQWCRDEEEELDTLRRFRNTEFLRIALNDLWGALGPDGAAAQISKTAEVCLDQALGRAWERLTRKFGVPEEESGAAARFAVLGLGKLGGRELDYQSDLDVLFLYSGPGRTRLPDGTPRLANAEFFARLAQRIMGALGTRTREGIAFRMDARLRPSGQAGPLVTSLASFADYHRGGSQVWERQALLKARTVAGDRDLGRAAEAVVEGILFAGPPAEDPRPEIAAMRQRIEREIGREEEGRVDLKAGPGGLVDIRFAVEALQLLHGWRAADLRSPHTGEALEALRRHGLVSAAAGEALEQDYRFLRRVEARLRVLHDRPTDALPREPDRLLELARGVGYDEAGGHDALVAEIARCRRRVRAAYEEIMGAGEP